MYDYRESREHWEWANLAPFAGHSSDPSLNWRRSDNNAQLARPLPPRPRPADEHFPDLDAADIHTDDLAGSQSRFKTAFQIDKERIASSTAFRRLESKTQVFVAHEGDHFRTRLTHTIEVDETARAIAQALHLNEDLTNAIALGHDLGHTPFGHDGETALNQLFEKYWPKADPYDEHNGENYGPVFFHNVQSVRVVDSLEKGYDWDRRQPNQKPNLNDPPIGQGWGLDLTWAVREGILKHSSRGLRAKEKDPVRMYGTAYLMDELAPSRPATLEGQVLEFADEIASLTHDVEDGLRSRVFKIEDVRALLKGQIKSDSLNELLGLSPHFGNLIQDDTRLQSRARKFHALLDEIYAGPCTMGIVLAFLRNMLLSNIIEASAWRLRACLAGSPTGAVGHQPARMTEAGPEELIWLNFTVSAPPRPTQNSYCSDAWEVDAANRIASLQTFRRTNGLPEPTSERIIENVRTAWNMKTADPQLSRHVTVERENGQVTMYPLGNVCITIDGAKIIGYHSNMLEFRRELRKGFIPEHLHRAPVVFRMNNKGQRYLTQIFELYYNVPRIMHRSALRRFDMWEKAVEAPEQLQQSKAFILRIVENLQGMTDRYLTEEYNRLFQPGAKMEERNEMDMVDIE